MYYIESIGFSPLKTRVSWVSPQGHFKCMGGLALESCDHSSFKRIDSGKDPNRFRVRCMRCQETYSLSYRFWKLVLITNHELINQELKKP